MRAAILLGLALTLTACGQQTEKEAPPVTTTDTARWDANLTAMIPFIDACLAHAPDSRWVSYADDTGEALVTVRLSGSGGNFDCTVPNDDPSAATARITPRQGADLPGENEAIFVRAPGSNPGGECYDAPEVRSADGALLGWMADPEGC